MPRCVVSLTTTICRIQHCETTLRSILEEQTVRPDTVYLHVPVSVPVPSAVTELTRHKNLVIHRPEKDHGPVTKLYETLLLEKDPETRIITVDDDFRYPPLLIQTLMAQNSCCGLSGFVLYTDRGIIKRPRQDHSSCQVLEGFAGVLYLRKYFENDFLELVQEIQTVPEAKFSDDLIIGNYLESKQVPRIILSNGDINALALLSSGALPHGNGKDALKHTMKGRYLKCMEWLKRTGKLHLNKTFREALRLRIY